MAAENGDTIIVHYVGTLDDETQFDSSRDRNPITFVLGEGMLIPGFENAVLGQEAGTTVTVAIAPEDAYGEYIEDMVATFPRSELPDDITPEVGMTLFVTTDDGEQPVRITNVTKDEVELNGNHELAGESLHFVIEIMSIEKK